MKFIEAAIRAKQQRFRRIKRQRMMTSFAHQIALADHLAAVVNAMVVDVFEHLFPFQLRPIGNIR